MSTYQAIDALIQEGYRYIYRNDYIAGCDKWLKAWEEIKGLFSQGIAKDVFDLDKRYNFTEFISNYVQDMETELHNAGMQDKTYHQKRIEYCCELLQWCGTDEQIISNTRRGMADAHFWLGETVAGEKLYNDWLEEYPDWGWGYIGWSDNYHFYSDNPQYEKAEGILLTGYAREGLHDRVDLVERLVDLYEDMGNPDKILEFKKKLSELRPAKPESMQYQKSEPVRVVKVGRNEPCPCESGKKYKKCCGG